MTSTTIDVFLVPLGPDRHDLYCEAVVDDAAPDEGAPRAGVLRGLVRRFRDVLATAEREHREREEAGARPHHERTLMRRLRDRVIRWLAEAIAEQRLLWQLRRAHQARLVFPDDLPDERAQAILRGTLRRDFDRHRRWLVIDTIALVVAGVLTVIPGPNVVAYYFAFRVVGHYLSMRGARQALNRVVWTSESSRTLTDVRAALALGRGERDARVRELAGHLQLAHLPRFLARTALRTA